PPSVRRERFLVLLGPPLSFGKSITLLRAGCRCDVTCDVTLRGRRSVVCGSGIVGSGDRSSGSNAFAASSSAFAAHMAVHRHHRRGHVAELGANDPVRNAFFGESRERRMATIMKSHTRQPGRL